MKAKIIFKVYHDIKPSLLVKALSHHVFFFSDFSIYRVYGSIGNDFSYSGTGVFPTFFFQEFGQWFVSTVIYDVINGISIWRMWIIWIR